MWEENRYTPQPQPQPPKSDSLIDGFVLPAAQALFTGLFAALAAGVLSAVLRVPASPWVVGFCIFSLAVLASWLSYRGRWAWRLERLLGLDLNFDGYVGAPQAPEPARTIRVELLQDEGKRGDFIDLPFPEKLPQLAAGLLAGRTFAQESFNHVLKRPAFNELRDVMLTRGLARWKVEGAPTQGIELTPSGRAIMRRLANHPPTLPPGER